MKRMILGGLIAAACAAGGGAAVADGYDDTGAVYLAPLGQYTFLDKDRISNNRQGYQVGLGYNFAPNFALEIAQSNGSFRIDNAGASEKLSATSLDLLYKFLPVTSRVRPFVIAGTGSMTDNVGRISTNNTGWLAEAGAGVFIGIGDQTGSTRFQFRTEAKYRYEFMKYTQYVPNDPRDVVVGAGFQLMFGAPTPPPPPPPPVDGDDDGDGVPNSIDRCPNTPRGDMVDAYGCTIKDEIKLEGVNFATASWTLVPESAYVLDYGVATLKKHPNLVIEVHGHTDSVGSVKYNIVLSQHRAESVMAYLREHGVTNTMTAKGYGKEHPIADNATADGRLQNRRVALHIVSVN